MIYKNINHYDVQNTFLSFAINQGLKTKFIQLLGYAIPAPRPLQNNWSPKHGQLDFSKVSDSISNFNIPWKPFDSWFFLGLPDICSLTYLWKLDFYKFQDLTFLVYNLMIFPLLKLCKYMHFAKSFQSHKHWLSECDLSWLRSLLLSTFGQQHSP